MVAVVVAVVATVSTGSILGAQNIMRVTDGLRKNWSISSI